MAERHINLLPPERRRNLRRGVLMLTAGRLIHMLLLVLGLLTLAGVGTGVGLWLTALQVESATEVNLAEEVARYRDSFGVVVQRNQLLESVDTIENDRVIWSAFIERLLAVVPPGVDITTMEGTFPEEEATLSFSGVGNARAALVIFEDNLRQLSWVSHLQAPRSNLLKPLNAPYIFGLTLNPENL